MNASTAAPPPLPLRHCYWVVPGLLLAGEHPGGPTRDKTKDRLKKLLAAGIECFVDLTKPTELARYDTLLPFYVEYTRKAIKDHGLPASRDQMIEILDAIGNSMRAGRPVYVHCRAGIGRTGTVIGCLLVERGLSGDGALDELNRLWQQSKRSRTWAYIPETEAQATYVREWHPSLNNGGFEINPTAAAVAAVGPISAAGDTRPGIVTVADVQARAASHATGAGQARAAMQSIAAAKGRKASEDSGASYRGLAAAAAQARAAVEAGQSPAPLPKGAGTQAQATTAAPVRGGEGAQATTSVRAGAAGQATSVSAGAARQATSVSAGAARQATSVPAGTGGQATSVPARAAGQATSVPAGTGGQATSVSAGAGGQGTSMPAGAAGQATSVPARAAGQATSVPAGTGGQATSVSAGAGGQGTSMPAGAAGQATSVPAGTAGQATSVSAGAGGQAMSVSAGAAGAPVPADARAVRAGAVGRTSPKHPSTGAGVGDQALESTVSLTAPPGSFTPADPAAPRVPGTRTPQDPNVRASRQPGPDGAAPTTQASPQSRSPQDSVGPIGTHTARSDQADGADPLFDPATLMAARALRERFVGAMLGLAVGDALAAATQYRRPGTFTPVGDMIGGGPFDLPRGAWSDDTAMALCLAESLLECNGFDARDQVQRYGRWQQEGYLSSTGQCVGITGSTARSLAIAKWRRVVFPGSHDPEQLDPEPLSRLAPIALYYFSSVEATMHQAAESSRTTCQAPAVLDACRLFARSLHAALSGQPKAQILADLGQATEGPAPTNNTAATALATGLWAFSSTNNFRDAVLRAVNVGGNSDVVASVCGQLAGAHYGFSAILPAWCNGLIHKDLIESYADRLLAHALVALSS